MGPGPVAIARRRPGPLPARLAPAGTAEIPAQSRAMRNHEFRSYATALRRKGA